MKVAIFARTRHASSPKRHATAHQVRPRQNDDVLPVSRRSARTARERSQYVCLLDPARFQPVLTRVWRQAWWEYAPCRTGLGLQNWSQDGVIGARGRLDLSVSHATSLRRARPARCAGWTEYTLRAAGPASKRHTRRPIGAIVMIVLGMQCRFWSRPHRGVGCVR
jgi:hypothetical protein